MSIHYDHVKLDGVNLLRIWSDRYVKIRCVEDANIYQIAYVTDPTKRTFQETNLSIEQQHMGYQVVEAKNVLNLSGDVLAIISANNEFVTDVLDGTRDYEADINAGGAR